MRRNEIRKEDTMFKIWAKTIKDHKITASYLYHSADKFDSEEFLAYVAEICNDMDIPTPVILKSHVKNYLYYNVARFRPSDFVESVPFDTFLLENASE